MQKQMNFNVSAKTHITEMSIWRKICFKKFCYEYRQWHKFVMHTTETKVFKCIPNKPGVNMW